MMKMKSIPTGFCENTGNICKTCGEHILDCDCSGTQEWHSFDYLKPTDGQKCRIECIQVLDAVYQEKSDSWNMVEPYSPKKITVWRPLLGK
jgi:hypothetical protein